MLRAGFWLIACVSLVAAQDQAQAPDKGPAPDKNQAPDTNKDKVSVPLSSPSQPATIKIHLVSGSITVTGGSGTEVVVESKAGFHEGPGDVPAGMHRLDTGQRSGLNIAEDHNVVTIGTGPAGGAGDLSIQVPVNSSVTLKALNGGHVDVTGVNGELDIENMNGPITLKGVSGSVTAHALNGGITVALDKVTAEKPMSFTCMNGPIDVTLPADTRARLRMKTDHGSVYTDFEVKVDTPDAGKNVKGDKTVIGSINGGGPEFRFETVSGNILLHKK
jgi:DUF4097 and DUF4098 domain-containing protein YvlB